MASRSSSEDKPKRAPKQAQTYESEGEESAEETYQPPAPRRRSQRPTRQQQQQKGGSGPLDNLALDSVQNTAGGLVNGVTGTLGNVAGNAVQNQGGGDKGKSDTLRLRLDLNLDIEITLKAKIHGDLELALLSKHLIYGRIRLTHMGNYRKQVDIIPQQAMTSPDSDPKPTAHQNPSLSEDDLVEVEHEGSDDEDVAPGPEPESGPQPEARKVTKPGEPAYVAPIPKIGPISPISPVSHPFGVPPSRPPLPKFVGSFLVGRTVDEAGDIVDETTGQVLARAAGDLPSIVGRKVSNNKGDILGDDGSLLGWVADLEIERKGSNAGSSGISPSATSPMGASMAGMRSLAEMMGRANASLVVDHAGNILDAGGNVVGKFHDNNNPAHRKEREEQERAKAAALQAAADRAVRRAVAAQEAEKKAEAEDAGEEGSKQAPPTPPEDEEGEHEPECNCSKKKPRRTEEERRENAAAWRKEKPGESPSDIFLDVKSTTEGIQLTIRIPTVFNGSQVRPTVQFS
ncbi:hypothetical protein CONLIGDRAFT_678931 [Coniochaeta ligniaria NRRL 30616]|uniref:Uncharacterized protein n=1 Tax=Coniochaeta ligniaria NRRL 30616 TaxID=1408157 RepID=A0A1J7IZ38_9PEZI|nr:hypothetical protein CONLIGDRAFT_678931 [Coniochaeta ligniaria NRRL 30616]